MENKTKINWLKLLGQILLWYVIIFVVTVAADALIGQGIIVTLFKRIFPETDALETALFYITFVGTWIVVPLFIWLWKKNRPILKALSTKASGNNWKLFLLGLLLGGGMNGLCAFAAWLNGDIVLHFDNFRPVSFLLIFVCVFIQSSAEELYTRGFLYQKFMKLSGLPAVAIIGNALFFAVMHLFNNNITVLSILNIATIGVFYSLMVYYMDSIWCTMAHHAAWNFTQNILLGLPNSGNVVPYSVFMIDAATATSSFAYDAGFGIEGSMLSFLLTIAGCVVIILWGKKHLNVWAEASEN